MGAATAGVWAIVDWAESVYGTPSCSWSLRVRGTATPAQVGLARCYVQALANRDYAEMAAVARNMLSAHITSGLFLYTPDARAGLATATFTPSPVDSTYELVTIRFANGTVEQAGMLNMRFEHDLVRRYADWLSATGVRVVSRPPWVVADHGAADPGTSSQSVLCASF